MATELTMPQMGYDMAEGTVVRWLKQEGSPVSINDPVAEIETDKAVVEFVSDVGGTLLRILADEGTVVPVGDALAIIGHEREVVEDEVKARHDGNPQADETEINNTSKESLSSNLQPLESTSPSSQSESPQRTLSTPIARRLAKERNIDLSKINGTGPGGRITRNDVLEHQPETLGTTSAPPPVVETTSEEVTVPDVTPRLGTNIEPLSRMRRQIARVTVRSKQDKPHFYVTSEINMTRAMELRSQINQDFSETDVRITVNDFIIKACINALKKYPKFNAFFHDEGIEYNDHINVGIAISGEEGLIVPAILNCEDKTLPEISTASRDLANRSQNGSLNTEEYNGGTFAISNMGMFDVSSFSAIIHTPQTAVLAVGTVAKKPVVKDDSIVIAQIMTATLSADHRIVDGADGAHFLMEVKTLLENPLRLLM